MGENSGENKQPSMARTRQPSVSLRRDDEPTTVSRLPNFYVRGLPQWPTYENRAHSRPYFEQLKILASINQQNEKPYQPTTTYDPRAPLPPFDMSRASVLNSPLPPIHPLHYRLHQNHASTYRLQWNRLGEWNSFPLELNNYWEHMVPQSDKDTGVYYNQLYSFSYCNSFSTNRHPLNPMHDMIPTLLRVAWSNGFHNSATPSDKHSTFTIDYSNKNRSSVDPGVQQFMFVKSGEPPRHHYLATVTAPVEWTSPLAITPQDIDELLQGFPSRIPI